MTRSILFAMLFCPFSACDLYAQTAATGEATKSAYAMLLGSGSEFRGNTTYLANGQIARSIFQETAHTPKEAQRDGIWKNISYPKEDAASPQLSFLFGAPSGPGKPTLGDTFFQASGLFVSADKVPDHVRLKSAPGMPASKLILQASRTDLVFVAEYSWRETLTKMDKPGKEREELAHIAVGMIERIIDDAIGKDYDATDLLAWLRKEGKQELISLLTELDAAGPDKTNEVMEKTFQSRMKKWSLHSDKDLASQLMPLIARSVRDKSGKPVSEKTVRSWLDTPILFQNKRIDRLQEHGAQFLYTMTLPGVILETNGINGAPPEKVRSGGGMCCSPARPLVQAKKVVPSATGQAVIHWSFGRHQAHTSDYTMHVRTLSSDKALQEKLFKKVPLEAKEAAIAYRDLVKGRESLLKVLRECRTKESMQPLYAYRDQLAATQDEERDSVNSVMKILGM